VIKKLINKLKWLRDKSILKKRDKN